MTDIAEKTENNRDPEIINVAVSNGSPGYGEHAYSRHEIFLFYERDPCDIGDKERPIGRIKRLQAIIVPKIR